MYLRSRNHVLKTNSCVPRQHATCHKYSLFRFSFWKRDNKVSKQSCPCASLIKQYAMKTYGRVHIQTQVFLTSALVGGEWSASHPGRFTPVERAPGTHWTGGLVASRGGLEDVEKRKLLTLPDSTGPRTLTPQMSSP
jgi:hypothetical protein